MDTIQSLLNIVVLPLTLVAMCFVLPLYWVYKISSYLVRSVCPENVKGKVVLITGASSGIGEHVAYGYAKRGARLALAARRKDRLLIVADKAREMGSPDTLVIVVDVSVPEECHKMVQQTITRFGKVDHLVNNARIIISKFLEDYSNIQEMNSIMGTNFWGVVHTTRSAMAHLRLSRGKIVVISSISCWTPTPRLGLYAASKGALMSLFETLRVEVGNDVKITLVTPGLIETEMTTISTNPSTNDDGRNANEGFINLLKRSEFPMEKVEVCAKAIVRSVCRGDRYLTEPKWVLSTYCVKILCPEILEILQRLLLIDLYNKFM